MGPVWGRQDPDGPHVGPMNFAIWVHHENKAPPSRVYIQWGILRLTNSLCHWHVPDQINQPAWLESYANFRMKYVFGYDLFRFFLLIVLSRFMGFVYAYSLGLFQWYRDNRRVSIYPLSENRRPMVEVVNWWFNNVLHVTTRHGAWKEIYSNPFAWQPQTERLDSWTNNISLCKANALPISIAKLFVVQLCQ